MRRDNGYTGYCCEQCVAGNVILVVGNGYTGYCCEQCVAGNVILVVGIDCIEIQL